MPSHNKQNQMLSWLTWNQSKVGYNFDQICNSQMALEQHCDMVRTEMDPVKLISNSIGKLRSE